MIIVDIRESDLAGACEGGIAFWRSIATMSKRGPKGELRMKVKWSVFHQLWASVACPSFFGWAREQGLVPQISMRSADLRGASSYVAYPGWKLENGLLVKESA